MAEKKSEPKEQGPWKKLEDVAAHYNIPIRTFQEWAADNNKIPRRFKRKIGRDWRIHLEKYDNWLELKGGA